MLAETARKGKREMRDQGSVYREFTLIDRIVLRTVLETARRSCIYGQTQPEMMLDGLRRQPPFDPQRYAEFCAEFAPFNVRVIEWSVRVRVIGVPSPPDKMRWEKGWIVVQEQYGSDQRLYAPLKLSWEPYYPSITIGDFVAPASSPFPYLIHQGLDRCTIEGPGLDDFWVRDKRVADRILDIIETAYLLGQTYGYIDWRYSKDELFSANRNDWGLTGNIDYKSKVFRVFTSYESERLAKALNQVYAEGAKLGS